MFLEKTRETKTLALMVKLKSIYVNPCDDQNICVSTKF